MSLYVYLQNICLACTDIHVHVCVQEKEKALISDDYGKDLASVQALQRKYEGFVVSNYTSLLDKKMHISSSL